MIGAFILRSRRVKFLHSQLTTDGADANLCPHARVAELVDAPDSKSGSP